MFSKLKPCRWWLVFGEFRLLFTSMSSFSSSGNVKRYLMVIAWTRWKASITSDGIFSMSPAQKRIERTFSSFTFRWFSVFIMMLIKVVSLVMGLGFMLRAGAIRMKGFCVNLVNLFTGKRRDEEKNNHCLFAEMWKVFLLLEFLMLKPLYPHKHLLALITSSSERRQVFETQHDNRLNLADIKDSFSSINRMEAWTRLWLLNGHDEAAHVDYKEDTMKSLSKIYSPTNLIYGDFCWALMALLGYLQGSSQPQ